MSARPLPVPRIVKARRRGNADFPIIAVNRDSFLVERTGELHPITDLPAAIVSEPSSIIAGQTIGWHVEALNEAFQHESRWQFRASPTYTRGILANGKQTRAVLKETVFAYFGFEPPRDSDGKPSHKGGHYHYPLDPVAFVRKTIHEIEQTDRDDLLKLMSWAAQVREWCVENELAIRPSSGGLAGALLRDPRFYPNPRALLHSTHSSTATQVGSPVIP